MYSQDIVVAAKPLRITMHYDTKKKKKIAHNCIHQVFFYFILFSFLRSFYPGCLLFVYIYYLALVHSFMQWLVCCGSKWITPLAWHPQHFAMNDCGTGWKTRKSFSPLFCPTSATLLTTSYTHITFFRISFSYFFTVYLWHHPICHAAIEIYTQQKAKSKMLNLCYFIFIVFISSTHLWLFFFFFISFIHCGVPISFFLFFMLVRFFIRVVA